MGLKGVGARLAMELGDEADNMGQANQEMDTMAKVGGGALGG